MSSTVNHHVAMATERTIQWSLGRPPRTSLRRLVVAEFLDITGLPDSRQSRVTRQGQTRSSADYEPGTLKALLFQLRGSNRII
jgi:hypothetical protein